MTLGSIRFSVQDGAYQRLRRELEITVARQARAGAQVARQVLGEDETIEIEGEVFLDWRGGLDRVQSFRDAARTYAPLTLTDGAGKVWGQYLIERVTEDGEAFLENGVPLRQAFRLSLGLAG